MSTEVKKKQTSKGVRLGWTPLKEVKPVKLTPDSVKGKNVTTDLLENKGSSYSPNSLLIP